MNEQKSLLHIEQEQGGGYDSHRNSILNLNKFQIKKILKNENENHKNIEVRLSELMDNKIKYKKNKISNKLYVVKTKKIVNKARPTPYQLYENIKKEILSKSILKLENDKLNSKRFNSINQIFDLSKTHPLKFKKIIIRQKGMLSGSKYSVFPILRKKKNKEENKCEEYLVDKKKSNNMVKNNTIYQFYINNFDDKYKNKSNKNIERNKYSTLFIIGNDNIKNKFFKRKFNKCNSIKDFKDCNNNSLFTPKNLYPKILPNLYNNNNILNFNFSSSL